MKSLKISRGMRAFVVIVAVAVTLGCGRTSVESETATQFDASPAGTAEWIASLPFAARGDIASRAGFELLSTQYFETADAPEAQIPARETTEPLRIVEYGPVGELPVENRRPTVFVTFSQPMVPLTALDAPMRESNVMSVEPARAGVYRWYGSRVLAFQPDEPFTDQRLYTVTVSADARSVGGKRLGQSVSFSFHNEPLRMVEVFPGLPSDTDYVDPDDIPPDAARTISVQFNYPVDIAALRETLVVEGDAEGRFPVQFRKPAAQGLDPALVARTLVVELGRAPAADQRLTVRLLAGASSGPGMVGRQDAQDWNLHTVRPFRFVHYNARATVTRGADGRNAYPVYLYFSHPVDPDTVAGALHVEIPHLEAGGGGDLARGAEPASGDESAVGAPLSLDAHTRVWDATIMLSNLPVQPESRFVVRIGAGLRDRYGRPIAEERDVVVEVPAAGAFAHFPNSGARMLEAQFPPRIVFEYQNVASGRWHAQSTVEPYRDVIGHYSRPFDLTNQERNTRTFELLELSPWLNAAGFGAVALAWELAVPGYQGRLFNYRNALQVQVTDLGVTTRVAYNRIVVWVRSLTDGQPVAGARVSVGNYGRSHRRAETDASGLVTFDFQPGEFVALFADPSSRGYRRSELEIIVRNGDDMVKFRPNQSHNPYQFGVGWVRGPLYAEEPRMETLLFTDRGLYRPGETVSYRGIDRTYSAGEYRIYNGPFTLAVREDQYNSEPILRGTAMTSTSGGSSGRFTIPPDLAPGRYLIEYEREGMQSSVAFQVAAFQRSDFEVRVEPPARTLYFGEPLSMRIRAAYLAGGSLSGQAYDYYWLRSPARFAPPGAEWSDYLFGPDVFGEGAVVEQGSGTLPASGETGVSTSAHADVPTGRAQHYTLEARVRDISNRELSARSTILVHPASHYVGLRLGGDAAGTQMRFGSVGRPVQVEVAAVGIDGQRARAAHAPAQLTLIRREWQAAAQRDTRGHINTRYERVDHEVQHTELDLADGAASFRFVPDHAGSYLVRVDLPDSAGRIARSELSMYVTGSEWVRWGELSGGAIRLIPDRERYNVGDTARILVQSSLPRGEYLLTLERDGIMESRLVSLEGSAAMIEVTIGNAHVPAFYVALSSSRERTAEPSGYGEPDLGKPLGLFGIVRLAVDPGPRVLDLEIIPDQSLYRPAGRARVEVRVRRGQAPVEGAEVTLLAVDRGVLDLIDYRVPDPVAFFYDPAKFALNVEGADSRSLLIDPVTYELRDLVGGDAEEKLERREDFTPLAVFEPELITDSEGRVFAEFDWPHTLTTYRLTAVAVAQNDFGKAEREVGVRNPLNARSVVPARLRVRDTAEVGLQLTNIGESAVDVSLDLEVKGFDVDGPARATVRVGAGETRVVPFVVAAAHAGTAELSFTVRSAVLSEVVVARIPVETPVVAETFTVVGDTAADGVAEESLIIPSNIAQSYGHVAVRAHASSLPRLSGSIAQLVANDWDYMQAQVYRHLPLLYFGEDVQALGIEGATDADGRVRSFMARLAAVQGEDGGFPTSFEAAGRSNPTASMWAAFFLAQARLRYSTHEVETMGFDAARTTRLLDYLAGIHSRSTLSPHSKLLALYVRSLFGVAVRSGLDELTVLGDELGMSGMGLAALAYLGPGAARGTAGGITDSAAETSARRLFDRMRNFILVGTRSVDFIQTYEQRSPFDQPVQRLALLLMLYERLEPDTDMRERLSNTILSAQRYGRWNTLPDAVWALTAFAPRIDEERRAVTNFTLRAEVDETTLFEHTFAGLVDEPAAQRFGLFDAPLRDLPRNRAVPLRFESRGEGRAYYAAELSYALPAEIVAARDEGLGVIQRYSTLDGDPVNPEQFEVGRTYRVTVTLSSAATRYMVILRVPLPSGARVLDASFVSTGTYIDAGGIAGDAWERESIYGERYTTAAEGRWRWSPYGFDLESFTPRTRIFDNEIRYSFDQLYAGSRTVSFLMRTETPGIFPTPPAEAAMLEEPEVFGRARGALVVIRNTAR